MQRDFYNIFKVAIANRVKCYIISVQRLAENFLQPAFPRGEYGSHAYIIYYVEPIAICQENLLLLLSDVGAQQEEESAPFAGEILTTALRGAGGVVSVRIVVVAVAVGEAPGAAVIAAQPCLQGLEKRSTHSRLTHRKYTVRLTKMLSNSMQALRRDEEVSVRAKIRLLTRSRGPL
ncbi:MAG TPA: hypothetical protein VHJ59_08050 [Nitrososphaera sp.]|nr:hypothetical protein [Nitrososphaera sp.]